VTLPFDLVYTAMFDSIVENTDHHVRQGNYIRLDTDKRDVMKPRVQVADLPEIILAPVGGSANLHASSNTVSVIKQWAWMISTGDYRIGILHQVEWEILEAMTKCNLYALTYKNMPFVKRVDITDMATGASDPERNRNITGWSSLWTVEVEMHFTNMCF